jgi:integrase
VELVVEQLLGDGFLVVIEAGAQLLQVYGEEAAQETQDTEWIRRAAQEDWVVLCKAGGLRWRVKVVFREAGLDHEDPYIMRHTFASLMDDAGMDHQEIADTMGHRDVTTFDRLYRHRLKPEIRQSARPPAP